LRPRENAIAAAAICRIVRVSTLMATPFCRPDLTAGAGQSVWFC
jgi:hypothetical protein